jgi:tape measure domain-containing protein
MLAPAAVIGGMGMLAKAASESASNMENLVAQFELFTGSAAKANELIADLRKIAVESPLEMTDMAEGARNLLTYGVSAAQTAKIVEQLSEVSAGSAERFGRITYAFGQIASIGRLMGTELRQLTEAGFNPLEYIGRRTGETMIQLRKRMEDGGIAIGEVEQALTDATSAGGRFYGLNAKMAQTFSGRVSMMKDQWSQMTAALGEGMNEGLKFAVDAITENMPKFKESFTQIGNALGEAIADAVHGDMEGLKDIGWLIGSTIAAAATAAFQSGSQGLVAGAENIARGGIRKGISVVAGEENAQKILPDMGKQSFADLFEAAMINNGVREKAAAITGNAPQPYQPSTQSPQGIQITLDEFDRRMDKIIKELKTKGSKL